VAYPKHQINEQNYYYFDERKVTWQEAKESCNRLNQSLVTIKSEAEHTFLQQQMADASIDSAWTSGSTKGNNKYRDIQCQAYL
jgi:hypothetical protein